MGLSFAPLPRTLAACAGLAVLTSGALVASAQTQAAPQTQGPQTTLAPTSEDNGTIPAGGKFKVCHGYVRHVSTTNMKVHCIDGNPSDQSFLYVPKFAKLSSGKTVETVLLKVDTPVHVYYTQSLGIKKAYRVFVDNSDGHEVTSVKT
jgi:hypothetical protein